MSASIYSRVTDALLEQLSNTDPGSWTCPWHSFAHGLPVNIKTGKRYRGINILMLASAGQSRGFGDNRWGSYRQWQSIGGQVRKGEKGTLIVFYKDSLGSGSGQHGDSDAAQSNRRYVLRTSIVFNGAQVDGAPEVPRPQTAEPFDSESFDRFVARTGATIRFVGTHAFYSPAYDEIHLPPREHFITPEGYMATLAHELIHWSGAKDRLSRDLSGRFGNRAYAAEELVAELGSAFLLAILGFASMPRPDHARYVASWLPLVKDDPRAIFVAAAQASRAADWLFEIAAGTASELNEAAAGAEPSFVSQLPDSRPNAPQTVQPLLLS
jgi:antirestriction protein ArdC